MDQYKGTVTVRSETETERERKRSKGNENNYAMCRRSLGKL